MNIKTLFLLSFLMLMHIASIMSAADHTPGSCACHPQAPQRAAAISSYNVLTDQISDINPPAQTNTPSLTDSIKNNILLLAMNSVWQDLYTTLKGKIRPVKPDHLTHLTQNLQASNAHLALLVAERTRLEDKLKSSDLTAADKDHVKEELKSTEHQIASTKKLQAQVLEAHTAQVLKGLGKHVHGAGCKHDHEHGHSHA